MLSHFFANAINTSLNKASENVLTPQLTQDAPTQAKLAKLAGKNIAFEIKKINQTLYFLPQADALLIETEAPKDIDVTIRAKPSTILKIARDGMDNAELESGELEIAGDAITGQRFAKLLSELNIDWEELLAQRIGDVPAHIFASGLGSLLTWSKDTSSALKDNVNEYLVEESRLLASHSAVNQYLDKVDTLRNDTARLAARIQQLKNR